MSVNSSMALALGTVGSGHMHLGVLRSYENVGTMQVGGPVPSVLLPRSPKGAARPIANRCR